MVGIIPTLEGVHVLVLGSATGMVLHTTFVASIIQFKHLNRETFSSLQRRQFPPYFAICAGAASVLTYTTYALGGGPWAWASLLVAGAGAGVNYAVIGPATRKWGDARLKMEKEGIRADAAEFVKVKKAFGAWHGASSVLNMGMVAACVGNCLWVGQQWAQATGR
ncbi:hypothetical protein HDU83_008198 [Entophlyctis luteolus]|nr:hypothetical protein HDU82_005092 [Entophlyctis luteolus]KAJ3352267.1 hypothetical protein HDU83_008198 [Entophlyctis luteolus]